MTDRAAGSPAGGKGPERKDALRARALALFAEGRTAPEVAVALGITERQARRHKLATRAAVRAHAAKTVEGVVEGAARARQRLSDQAHRMAGILVDAASGTLTDDSGAIVRDPAMLRARVSAASAALQFVLATKLEATVGGSILGEIAKHAASLRAERDEE